MKPDFELSNNPVIAQMSSMDHDQILFCSDNQTGLKAIIAIHDTTLGPALGGTRMWSYDNELEAMSLDQDILNDLELAYVEDWSQLSSERTVGQVVEDMLTDLDSI